MKYADTHSDTLTELYLGNYGIGGAPLHISLKDAAGISPYIQIGAVWTDKNLSDDEAYARFFEVLRHIKEDPATADGGLKLCRTKAELDCAVEAGIPAFVLAVEGARLLGGDITRLDALESEGVRLMTLQWSGTDCIGGAWDTHVGLTDFGRELLTEMAKRRIAADVSHASDRTAAEILDYAEEHGLTVCASHSNSRSVCSHRRNLTDEQFLRIKKLGGIVGISMAPEHLSDSGDAGITDVVRHVYHYLSLGGEDTLCFGCDFDGISSTPAGIGGIKDIPSLRESLETEGITEVTLNKLFYGNAHRFIRELLD